ncbi:uncharacterized protein BDW70DRAFT_145170 [Aspergillus foveolatus]|uniref:uncharacterized protein n=1 Tax=Aspergillus foveolatus TaxID=210207 RepID=UPI003CCCC10B
MRFRRMLVAITSSFLSTLCQQTTGCSHRINICKDRVRQPRMHCPDTIASLYRFASSVRQYNRCLQAATPAA